MRGAACENLMEEQIVQGGVGFVSLLHAENRRVRARDLHGVLIDRRRKIRRRHCRDDAAPGRGGNDRADSHDVREDFDADLAADAVNELIERLAAGQF